MGLSSIVKSIGGAVGGSSLAGLFGGTALQYGGQYLQNEYNSKEARKNRLFQQGMRATQYQDAVRDLRAANLNPMLAYTQGGAGNVSGSQASTSGNPMEAAGSQALKGKEIDINRKLVDAQISTAKATADNQSAQAELNRAQTIGVSADNELKTLKGNFVGGINKSIRSYPERNKKHLQKRSQEIIKRSKTDKNWKNRQNSVGFR
jgi:hypothetical protein